LSAAVARRRCSSPVAPRSSSARRRGLSELAASQQVLAARGQRVGTISDLQNALGAAGRTEKGPARRGELVGRRREEALLVAGRTALELGAQAGELGVLMGRGGPDPGRDGEVGFAQLELPRLAVLPGRDPAAGASLTAPSSSASEPVDSMRAKERV
jgi:hypothetical protein